MSSATDVLLYTASGEKGMEKFNALVAANCRFEAHPFEVETDAWSGPNVFMGSVHAFGADYWSFYGDEVQDLLDAVTWQEPQAVVLIVRNEGPGGSCAEPTTEVYRPKFTVHSPGFMQQETVSQP